MRVEAPTTRWEDLYRYFGLKFGRMTVKVSLDRATTLQNGGHVAVWAGVSSPSVESWVQGGIALEGFDKGPQAYIERKSWGKNPQIKFRPMKDFGQVMKVKLRRKHGLWRVTIRWGKIKMSSPEVPVLHPNVIACLEIFDNGTAITHINGHRVSGHL